MENTHNDIEIDLESAQEKPPENHRDKSTAYLDGLRGLAALIVYLSHNVPWWYGTEGAIEHGFGYHGEHMLATLPFLRSIFTGGAAAVALFFVMSGYVLSVKPLKMLKEGSGKDIRWYLLKATVRRPFRLFIPVGAISLIFALCMQLPFGMAPTLSWPEPEPTLLAELWKWLTEFGWTVNIFAKHGQFDHWFPYDPPAWTMAAELKGSLAVFALLAVTTLASTRVRLLSFASTGVCLLFLYQWEIAGFMFGVVIAILKTENIKLWSHFGAATIVLYHSLLIIGWYILGQPHGVREPERSYGTPGWYYLTMAVPRFYYDNEFWRFWNIIGATVFVYAITNLRWAQSLLTCPTLLYLGNVSFCLYLIHIPFAWTIGDRFARVLGVIRQDFETPWDHLFDVPDIGPIGFSTGLLLWQAIVLPMNLFLASQATKRIDNPSVRFGKWLTSRIHL